MSDRRLEIAYDDGVVVVAAERVEEVLRKAVEREDRERDVMQRLEAGELTLDILGFRDVLDAQGIRLVEGNGHGG